jgi:signal transduction histidine kinase/CheY-like chemotaxis protein
MSSFVVAAQVWDEKGNVRGSSCGAESVSLSAGLVQVLNRMRLHLGRALDGKSLSLPEVVDGRSLECLLMPLSAADGTVNGAVAVLLDITEQNSMEAALRERRAFETLITTLSTHFINLAPPHVDEGINHALAAIGEFAHVDRAYIFRFSKDGTSMSNTHEWCAPGIEPQIENLRELPVGVLPWFTSRMRRQEVVHVPRVADLPEEAAAERALVMEQSIQSIVIVPMTYEHTVVGFLGFDSVQSEKTWPPEDIALLKIAGEMFVGAFERKLADDRRAQLEAELVQTRSLENVAKLAGGVAHDFNNLLAVILNYAATLRREVTDPRHVGYLNELYDSANQAARLTRQLLLVGRRGIVEPVLLDVNEAISSVVDLLRGTLGEHTSLRLELGDDVSAIKLGTPQIEQILLNVTLNARDALASGGQLFLGTATVDLDADYASKYIDVKPGRYTVLTVRDTGIGMAPEVAARAFEPFFTTKGALGTGLGLSTVHGIVKQAGGHLTLQTAPGEGSTLSLYFPAVDGDDVARPAQPSSPDPAPKGRGETILVVEDSPAVRRLVAETLSRQGYRVREAGTPSQALEMVGQLQQPIELLLTDVILPEMSGRALADRLVAEGKIRRVLYMSGYENEIIARHGVLTEGIRLLQKPFLEAELLEQVRLVLSEA